MNGSIKWYLSSLVGLLCLLLGSGCLSTSSYHTARPVEEGVTEMGASLELAGSIGDGEGISVTHPEVHVRRGISELADFGLSGGYTGTRADFNYMIVDSEPLAMSINPSLRLNWQGFFGVDDVEAESTMTWTPMLGLLTDFAASEELTFTLGLKPGLLHQRIPDQSETIWFVAASIGARIDLDAVHFFPEVNIVIVEDVDDFLWTFGVAVGF